MNAKEIALLLKILQGAYRCEFSEDAVDVYTAMLSDIPFQLGKEAVQRLVKTSKFCPSIAEIRQTALDIADPLPSVEDAYMEARMAARNYSPYDHREVKFSHPLIRKAVNTIGLETLAFTEDPAMVGAQFRRIYENLRQSEQAKRQSMPLQLTTASEGPEALGLPERTLKVIK